MLHNEQWLIDFMPLLPPLWLGLAAVLISGFMLYAAARHIRGWPWRAAALALCTLVLWNPVLIEEQREYKPDTVLVIRDHSSSNQLGSRSAETDKIATAIEEKLGKMAQIEQRSLTMADSSADSGGSLLFEAIARGTGDLPLDHYGAVIAITDGQIHDVPALDGEFKHIPLHILLTGKPDESDRRLSVIRSPSFALVGDTSTMQLRIDATAGDSASELPVTIRNDLGQVQIINAPVNQTVDVPLLTAHAGSNVFALSIPTAANELTADNNEAVVTINGVRNRLRVLLISGDPHPGTRVWRNYLKADPGVDLVHFTILRPPEKQDVIPTQELSLIAFPTKELFEEKLHEFDLVIFDRYRRLGVLPNEYLQNIVDYVKGGGALLDAEGPLPTGSLSLFDTPVGTILPGISSQEVAQSRFVPGLTDAGKRHPVTADLPGSGGGKPPSWGPWLRQTMATVRGGDVLLSGLNDKPLLVMQRVGEGRVAQLFSDHIWLWARGYEGGGPHSELLRRISHWLMKEPHLEENDLQAEASGRSLVITERSLGPSPLLVSLEHPGGETEAVTLTEISPGLAQARIDVAKSGLYRISNQRQKILIGVGGSNPVELHDIISTKDKLTPYLQHAEGSIRWISEDGIPDLRHLDANRQMSGQSWIGIRRNQNYNVAGIKQYPLIPPLAYLLAGLLLFMAAWRQEGR
jgi:hypothetical protein